jgi:RNA polymerase sigma-54 factor
MSQRPRLKVTTTQRMSLNTSLVTAIQTLRADAIGLTRYLEEAAAANPALVLEQPSLLPQEWLPRWTPALGLAPAATGLQAEAAAPGLIAHVMAHVASRLTSPRSREIALGFVEALEPSGWLGRPVSAISADLGCALREALAVLDVLQEIEPRGLFARSLAECLLLQAREAGVDDAPMTVILDNLSWLAQGDFARLARAAGVNEAEIAARLRIIRGFDPKPGAAFQQGAAPVREPDLVATRQGDGWQIALNRSALPGLSLAADRKLGQRGAARALIAQVASRNATLLRVGQEVLLRQWRALDQGLGAIVPMRMADVAASLGLHESTVSRVVAGTAVDTPRGTWWLRHLFSADRGGGTSAVALRDRLEGLIAEEDRQTPLSDAALAAALSAAEGVAIARRTVAKYRGLLRIPPAHARRATASGKRRPKG